MTRLSKVRERASMLRMWGMIALVVIGYVLLLTSPPVLRRWRQADSPRKLLGILLFTIAAIGVVGGLIAWTLYVQTHHR